MIGDLLRDFERAAVLEVRGDAGGAERVVADLRFDAGSGCSPLNDAVGVLLPEWFAAQHARFSGRRLKERLIRIASEARGGDVGVEQVFQFVVARHFMLFSAFFM